MTIHRIRDSVQFRAELEAVVKVGYANEHGESRLDTECIATPVMTGDVAVAGISITYPQGDQLAPGNIDALQTAGHISRAAMWFPESARAC